MASTAARRRPVWSRWYDAGGSDAAAAAASGRIRWRRRRMTLPAPAGDDATREQEGLGWTAPPPASCHPPRCTIRRRLRRRSRCSYCRQASIWPSPRHPTMARGAAVAGARDAAKAGPPGPLPPPAAAATWSPQQAGLSPPSPSAPSYSPPPLPPPLHSPPPPGRPRRGKGEDIDRAGGGAGGAAVRWAGVRGKREAAAVLSCDLSHVVCTA
jgi:hypothetical protein